MGGLDLGWLKMRSTFWVVVVFFEGSGVIEVSEIKKIPKSLECVATFTGLGGLVVMQRRA